MIRATRATTDKQTISARSISKTAGSFWWEQEDFPSSYTYTIQKLDDTLYPKAYFVAIQGQTSPYYLPIALELAGRVLGRPAKSVLELGNGGGYYAELLHSKGFDLLSVEGTRDGYETTRRKHETTINRLYATYHPKPDHPDTWHRTVEHCKNLGTMHW